MLSWTQLAHALNLSFGRERKQDPEFEDSLGHTVRSSLNKPLCVQYYKEDHELYSKKDRVAQEGKMKGPLRMFSPYFCS